MSEVIAGRVGIVVCWAMSALAAAGCSSSNGSSPDTGTPNMGPATANCGSVQQPRSLTLSNVQPAAGSSVPNSAVVQSFTIVGQQLQITPSFALPVAHTAGASNPMPVPWTITLFGGDTVYTSQPITWATPGHVELDPPGLLVTMDHCVWTLPTPTFSYDVTAP